MCPRRSSFWPAASQQKFVPQSAPHPPPPPRPGRGLQTEAAAEEPGPCRRRWPSAAPAEPGKGGRGAPYPELQGGDGNSLVSDSLRRPSKNLKTLAIELRTPNSGTVTYFLHDV